MPINIKRPNSALLRGVQITEFKGHIINPDPIILQETDFLLEEFLSPTKLKALTGVNDLSSVDYLEMIVDTSETSLANFGIYLPNLKQLKLNGSHVPRIRDLGTSLVNLRVLWLSRSGLTDLDGIPTLNSLEELYIAYNEISDLSSLSLLENLKCLDLEGNLIDDIKQVEFLNLCSNLINLTLYGNPLCVKASPDAIENDPNYSYRHEIIKTLPALQILDDELTLNTKPLSPTKNLIYTDNNKKNLSKFQINENKQECPFDDDWQIINKFIEEGIGPPEEKLAINESLRPGTSSSHGSRTSSSVRPLSAMRPLSSYRIKTSLVQQKPNSKLNTPNNNETTTRPATDPICDIQTDASNLTVGPTLQGNPLRSLLARRRNKTSDDSINLETNSIKPLDANLNQAPSYDSAVKILKNANATESDFNNKISNIEIENKGLKEEIKKWKKEHEKKLEERKEYFQPQVLKIDDTYEEPVLSDIENEDYENESRMMSFRDYQRPKSAFKKNFDYEQNNSKDLEKLNEDNKEKTKKTKDNKKSDKNSKDRSRSSSRSSKNKNDSRSSSRIATGDTGYESLSALSLSSSFTSSNNNLNIKNNGNSHSILNAKHQPKIVSTNSTSNSNLLNIVNTTNNSLSMKPMSQQSNSSTLKQLKTNLLPLSGIKLPK